jgi:hypothetical protein
MVPLGAGYDRGEMIQPTVMAAPLNGLVSDAARGATGRRLLAAHWEPLGSRRPGRLDRDRDNAHGAAVVKLAT